MAELEAKIAKQNELHLRRSEIRSSPDRITDHQRHLSHEITSYIRNENHETWTTAKRIL
jgi:hypothetical protein